MQFLNIIFILSIILLILIVLVKGFIVLLPFILLAYFVFWAFKAISNLLFKEVDDEIEVNVKSTDTDSSDINEVWDDIAEVKDAEIIDEDR